MRSLSLKRMTDLAAAAVLLVLSVPVTAAVATLIYLRMGRPVLFRQQRAGRDGRPFTLLKFRTMREASGPDGSPLSDDRRLTSLGRWLRRTSLDELPQLLNVLWGEMSLVGPRPLLVRYLDRYTPRQDRRHHVKPGLTGWAQINGRNAIGWEEKLELDAWYADHWSLRLDARIVLLTVCRLVRPVGVSHVGSATMPEFMGTAKQNRNALEARSGR